ncbi:MAG TPA: rod-binding protein [Oscillatoriaceae cyanobacterium]
MRLIDPKPVLKPLQSTPELKPLQTTPVAPQSLSEQESKLKSTVQQFASVLYAEMVEEMRKAGDDQDDDGNGDGAFGGGDTSMFMSLFDQKIGASFAQQNGASLATALYKQLSGKLEAQDRSEGGHP